MLRYVTVGNYKYKAVLYPSAMLECNRADCDGATTLIDSSERDWGNIIVEKYECEYGHTAHETLELV